MPWPHNKLYEQQQQQQFIVPKAGYYSYLVVAELSDVHIPGYDNVYRDRGFSSPDRRAYDGVCFYVRCSVNASPRVDLSIDQLKKLCIEIRK